MVDRKSKLMTRAQLAIELGVHINSISNWEKSGLPVERYGGGGVASLFLPADARKWLKDRDDAAKENGTYDLARERARKEKAQAILAEQTVAIRAGELLLKTEVEAIWCAEFAAIRARLLSWPTTLADQLGRAYDIGGVNALEAKLKDEVCAILTELSQPRKAPWPPKKKTTKKRATKKRPARKRKGVKK